MGDASVDRGTSSFSNLESSHIFRPFSNLRSFGRMLDDAAVIGTSHMISLFGVVFAGSDLTQIWDIDFKKRTGLWLANMNCLLTV